MEESRCLTQQSSFDVHYFFSFLATPLWDLIWIRTDGHPDVIPELFLETFILKKKKKKIDRHQKSMQNNPLSK